jgi:hypothetical protein
MAAKVKASALLLIDKTPCAGKVEPYVELSRNACHVSGAW